MENSEQFKEDNDNYLKLNQQNLDDEFPLFVDIISKDYNKDYKVPFYEHHKIEKEEKEENFNDIEKKKEEDIDINRLILENINKENYEI